MSSSRTAICVRSPRWRMTILRSTASRRARNSDSVRIGARRRPLSRPSRRRCPLCPVRGGERPAAAAAVPPVPAALPLGLQAGGAGDPPDVVVAGGAAVAAGPLGTLLLAGLAAVLAAAPAAAPPAAAGAGAGLGLLALALALVAVLVGVLGLVLGVLVGGVL